MNYNLKISPMMFLGTKNHRKLFQATSIPIFKDDDTAKLWKFLYYYPGLYGKNYEYYLKYMTCLF